MPADVTVAIPFRNDVRTLGLAIASVLVQSHRHLELILLDDGSEDGSLDLARSFADARVSVISDGCNRGLAHRLNQAAELAAASTVLRMDADDVMRPQRVERQAAFLDAHPSVQVLGSAAYVIDAAGRVRGIRSQQPLDCAAGCVFGNDFLVHPTVAARREWLLANPYDPAFARAQDKELWCRTFRTSRFAKLEEPLLFYREGGAFDWRKYRTQKVFDARAVLRHGPSSIGWPASLRKAVAVGGKLVVFRAASALSLEARLVSSRSAGLPADELRRASAELEQIRRAYAAMSRAPEVEAA